MNDNNKRRIGKISKAEKKRLKKQKKIKINKQKIEKQITIKKNVIQVKNPNDLFTKVFKDLDEDVVIDLPKIGQGVFEWLIYPMDIEEFKQNYYEKRPLLIKRKQADYYNGWLSIEEIENKISKMKLGQDITVTKYNGKERLNSSDNKNVWKNFTNDKWSIRFLKPYQHFDNIYKLVSLLESYWKCRGGANIYLTPGDSQGFAPHADDICAYICQLQGSKHWKVYKQKDNIDDEEFKLQMNEKFPKLPRFSSKDYQQNEIDQYLDVVYDVVLEEGDFLYIPRGFVHQAFAPSANKNNSLHLTLSDGYLNTYTDFLKKALPLALNLASNDNQYFSETNYLIRQSVPNDMFNNLGIIHSDNEQLQRPREDFFKSVAEFAQNIMMNLPFDAISDDMNADYQFFRLKPFGVLKPQNSKKKIADLNGKYILAAENICRLCVDAESAVIYHSLKNKIGEVHEHRIGIEFDIEDAMVLDLILSTKESFVYNSLFDEELNKIVSDEDKLRIIEPLINENILIVI